MIGALKRAYEGFRGFGDYAFSVPPLDGAFLPNTVLDEAPVSIEHPNADNIVSCNGALYFTCDTTIYRVAESGLETIDKGPAPITAMASTSKGDLIVAYEGGAIYVLSLAGERRAIDVPLKNSDATALLELRNGAIAVAFGATGRRAREWQHDLMLRGKTGSIWIIDQSGAVQKLAHQLAWPAGMVEEKTGDLLVTTAWDHSLARVDLTGKVTKVLNNLPAYPSKLISSEDGGYWLSFISIRNQLVEFVLRERKYVKRMMAEIDPEFWVCPALVPPRSPEAVMQAGAERHHGEMKPWAPSLSYGLVAKLSEDILPQLSWHSRADGSRHGITSIALSNGKLFATSRCAGGIIEISEEGTQHEE